MKKRPGRTGQTGNKFLAVVGCPVGFFNYFLIFTWNPASGTLPRKFGFLTFFGVYQESSFRTPSMEISGSKSPRGLIESPIGGGKNVFSSQKQFLVTKILIK